ncbi:MAG: hypothetical protein AAF557_27375 [Pseudomonadota bacterium]
MKFTTVANFAGNTFTDQFQVATPEAAAKALCARPDYPLRSSELIGPLIAPFDGLSNAWCSTLIDDDDVAWFVVIVKTA